MSLMSCVTPTVFVVDDDVSVRESLEALIRHAGWRAETFASAHDFLTRPRLFAPSCLVLDVSLPDVNGLDLQKRVASDRVDMPIIFITGHGNVPMTVRAMKAGAVEFLTKPFGDDALLGAIDIALQRSCATLGYEAELRSLRTRHGSLSRREQEVMVLVVAGLLNKQVGGELGITEITVKAHRGKVMTKMKAASFADLVRMSTTLRDAPPGWSPTERSDHGVSGARGAWRRSTGSAAPPSALSVTSVRARIARSGTCPPAMSRSTAVRSDANS
jgi:FixJ family two-component response regulator